MSRSYSRGKNGIGYHLLTLNISLGAIVKVHLPKFNYH